MWTGSVVAAVLAFLMVLQSSSGVHLCKSFKCPKPSGFFAHPADCHSYVKCSNGRPYVKHCAANLHFNELLGGCDFPSLAQCNVTKRYEEVGCSLEVIGQGSGGSSGDVDPSMECDCDCCMKPHKDCTKYYECKEDGSAYVMQCSEGLVFNPNIESCDYPTNYECPKPPTCECQCRYPVDGECNAYYQCKDGEAQKFYCPNDLLFDPDTTVCDYKENVDCGNTATLPPPGDCTVTTHDNHEDCKYWAANNGCQCAISDGDCSWQVYVARTCPRSCGCPGNNTQPPPPSRPDFPCVDCSSDQLFFQHPTNCRKFIKCSPYGPQEIPCPAGTVWDQNKLTCNEEHSTACVTGNYVGPDGECVGCVGCQPVTTAKPPTGNCTDKDPNCKNYAANGDCVCRPLNGDCSWQISVAETCPKSCGSCGGHPVTTPAPEGCTPKCPTFQGLFPHPRDCSKWVYCEENTAYVKNCPASLHFNAAHKVCDWPDQAGCTSGPNSECTIPSPAPPPATTLPPIVDPRCDCQCCHLPAEDCTSYYYCDENFQLSFHTCSEGLVFDPDLATCVYADQHPECPLDPPPVCECDCFYPSAVCNSYFKCEDRVPVKYECPEGLYWNQNKNSCDYPQNVNCTMVSTRVH
ncbi:uncharacterized protein [Panulirus ornatus]|uniref:uncharacterized protein n=1 Tax=Panulirus ornatus TaxID=150431 RepID=UPI003A8A8DCD